VFSVALNTTPYIPSRSRQPTAGAVLTAAHGDEPGSAMHPCVPRPGLHFTHWGSPCTSATPRNAHGRPSMGRPHQHRVVAAAPAPAPTTPRTPSPLSCVTRRVSTLGESLDYRVEPRRQTLGNLAAGRPYPASTTVGTFRRTLELPRKTVGGDKAHRGLHAGVAATDPLGSGAARHLFFQPHNGPQGSQPHRQPGIQSGWPVTGRPPRGPQGSRTHPRSGDPVRPAQLRGGVFGLFKFQKIVFPFEKS
jgi:hypothetical protein